MISVVTLDREYGCGGPAIAARLAERLGWQLWDARLTEELARRANCDPAAVQAREERRDRLAYRLLKSFMRGSFEASLHTNRLQLLDADRIASLSRQVVQEVAAQGRCVIVGRGAQFFLRDRPDTYHVFVYAPTEEKMRRELEAGRTVAHARRRIAATDRERARFTRKYFRLTWPSRHRYHLMVNTLIGDEAVVDTIVAAIAARDRPPAR